MALTFGLSGGKILSLSLFSLSRIFSLGGKKKKQKTKKKRKVTTRAAKVCDRKTRQSAIGRSGD
jgi:hypothetical protein